MESNLPTPGGEPGRPQGPASRQGPPPGRPQGPPARAASRQPPARGLRQGGLRGLPRGPPARPSRQGLHRCSDWAPGPSIAALVVVPSAALGVAIQGLHRCSTGAALGVAIQGLHRCSDWARGRQLLHLWCPGGCDRGAKNPKESQRIAKNPKESQRIAKNP